jgi:hypothetical protein
MVMGASVVAAGGTGVAAFAGTEAGKDVTVAVEAGRVVFFMED